MGKINETLVFDEHSPEYKKLELAAAMMSFLSPNQKRYRVDNTWKDVDGEVAWTTILGESGLQRWPEYQVLTDTSQRELLQLDNIQDILEFVQKFLQKTAIPR